MKLLSNPIVLRMAVMFVAAGFAFSCWACW